MGVTEINLIYGVSQTKWLYGLNWTIPSGQGISIDNLNKIKGYTTLQTEVHVKLC